MEEKEILAHVDHTLLAQTATLDEMKELCDEAMHYGTASVCIPPCYVHPAAEYMKQRSEETGEPKVPICTVVGFPNGNTTAQTKVFETEDAIKNGAKEIDMVINIGWLKDRRYDMVGGEIRDLRKVTEGLILKVIIEACLLTEKEKIKMCEIVTSSGADYIKTSTGFSTGGATFEDVKLFSEHIGPEVKIKAAGGISSLADAEKFLELGADRLGSSRIVKLVQEKEAD